jgi:hypothetical protein
MTSHNGPLWQMQRDTWRDMSHTTNGTTFVGGAGHELDLLVANSHRGEVDEIVRDLAEVTLALPRADAMVVLREVLDLLRTVAPDTIESRLSVPTTWTHDGATGGPITDETPPVKVEEGESLTDALVRRADASAAGLPVVEAAPKTDTVETAVSGSKRQNRRNQKDDQ